MKNIFKIAAFTAILILMIGLLGSPFRGGYWYLRGYLADRDCRIAGIQEEPEGQVDVLNVGDSLADIAITPVEMYRDYGITSYVMGRELQKCIETYYAIKLARQHQPIKVVLWASIRKILNLIWSESRNTPSTSPNSSSIITSGKD